MAARFKIAFLFTGDIAIPFSSLSTCQLGVAMCRRPSPGYCPIACCFLVAAGALLANMFAIDEEIWTILCKYMTCGLAIRSFCGYGCYRAGGVIVYVLVCV